MLTLDESVLEEKRVELESLCSALAADDLEGAGRVWVAGLRALDCAREFCEDGAAEAYTDMLGEAPRSLAVHRHVAFELTDLERTGDAAEIAAEAAQINPSDPAGYVLLGEVYRTLGLYAVAALAYREALNLGAADEAEIRAALADCLFGLRLHEQAAANYELSLSLDRQHVRARLGLAETFRRLGRYEDAAESYRRTLEIEPGRAEAHLGLGLALARSGRAEEAAQALRRCLELIDDLDWSQQDTLGGAFESLGLHEEAAAVLETRRRRRAGCEGQAAVPKGVAEAEWDEEIPY
jgi:tetratricopeptide (TPR) repeat protein